MRYLSPSLAIGALRRGMPIEQFLGPVKRGDDVGIRWVSIEPVGDSFEVHLHDRADAGNGERTDIAEFPPLDPEQETESILLGAADGEVEALELAESLSGAIRARWVTFGVAAEDYADYARFGWPA
ncbi:MAG: hypothetical protein HOV79_13220 [Hamadaea sp.]|nr:hypothetical protein [Hamadaea sp.]